MTSADPSPVLRLITAYWGSMALFAANELDLFTALGFETATPAALASRLGVAEQPLRFLLQALVGLGLLQTRADGFENADVARAYLVRGGPAFLGEAVSYGADSYHPWASLASVVRTGRPAPESQAYLGEDPERTRRFVCGMHSRAAGPARAIVEVIDLAPGTTLLDLGGGPGTYSVLLARKTPGLRAIVFDLPAIVAIAEEIIAAAGTTDRIRVQAGDYHVGPYPAPVGAALLSGILHRETEDECRRILERTFEALEHSGTVIISDVMLNVDRVSPCFATLFALHMVVSSDHGGAHSKDDQRRWLEQTGFVDVRIQDLPPPGVHSVITARKP